VFAFHAEHRLTPTRLRETSRRQVSRLNAAVERLDLNPAVARVEPMSEDRRAGFLAVRMPGATRVAQALRDRGVFADARGDVLRLGPAPYLRDDQLDSAVAVLGEQLNAARSR
jgi:kynureninase